MHWKIQYNQEKKTAYLMPSAMNCSIRFSSPILYDLNAESYDESVRYNATI